MSSTFWLKDNKLITENNKPILCDKCPCEKHICTIILSGFTGDFATYNKTYGIDGGDDSFPEMIMYYGHFDQTYKGESKQKSIQLNVYTYKDSSEYLSRLYSYIFWKWICTI